jgi:hypothetical protein
MMEKCGGLQQSRGAVCGGGGVTGVTK